jgi:hypothetical protein
VEIVDGAFCRQAVFEPLDGPLQPQVRRGGESTSRGWVWSSVGPSAQPSGASCIAEAMPETSRPQSLTLAQLGFGVLVCVCVSCIASFC